MAYDGFILSSEQTQFRNSTQLIFQGRLSDGRRFHWTVNRPRIVFFIENNQKWTPPGTIRKPWKLKSLRGDFIDALYFDQNSDLFHVRKACADRHILTYEADVNLAARLFMEYFIQGSVRCGKPISAKRIQNVMIPLRVIVRDAIDQYGWSDLPDPFSGLKLPKVRRIRIYPFNFDEWETVTEFMLSWYKPYFEFAVQTGLRPSEQVALKWKAIDDEYIHIELSRVRNREKSDLKTEESRRSIRIRPGIKKCLEQQRELNQYPDRPLHPGHWQRVKHRSGWLNPGPRRHFHGLQDLWPLYPEPHKAGRFRLRKAVYGGRK